MAVVTYSPQLINKLDGYGNFHMYRLLAPLFAMLFLSVFLGLLVLFAYFGTDEDDLGSIYSGTFFLLDQRLEHAQDIDKTLSDTKQTFGYSIDLKDIESLKISIKEKEQIKQGQFVVLEIDEADFIYKRSEIRPKQAWVLQTEETIQDEINASAIGPIKLIEDYLAAHDQDLWPEKLTEFQNSVDSNLPIALKTWNEVLSGNLTPLQIEQLANHKTVGGIFFEEKIHYLLHNSSYVLTLGPIETGWWQLRWIYENIFASILIIICLSIFVVMQLWVWPLWNNLVSLHRAAEKFGNGDLDSRVLEKRLSPIKHVAVSFNAMAQRIQALISSHKELTTAVSHELRTPLARMRFALEELVDTDDAKQKQHYYNEVVTDINELDSLINEMLMYATFERVKPSIAFSDIPLKPWLEQQFSRIEMLFPDLNCQLDIETLTADSLGKFEEKLLARALSNLLNNAGRYAKNTIRLSIQQTSDHYLFIVEDDGIGVPEDYRELIFNPFQRVDVSRDRDTGGFGIGLAIVKQITEWHSGKCYVEDSILGGAKFVLTLPT